MANSYQHRGAHTDANRVNKRAFGTWTTSTWTASLPLIDVHLDRLLQSHTAVAD